jgi:hypothetical protein
MLSFGYALAANADGVGDGGGAALGVESFRRIMAPFYQEARPQRTPVTVILWCLRPVGRDRRCQGPPTLTRQTPSLISPTSVSERLAPGLRRKALKLRQLRPLTFNLDLVVLGAKQP